MGEDVRMGMESERAMLLPSLAFLGLALRTHAGKALGADPESLNAGAHLDLMSRGPMGPGRKAQEGRVMLGMMTS